MKKMNKLLLALANRSHVCTFWLIVEGGGNEMYTQAESNVMHFASCVQIALCVDLSMLQTTFEASYLQGAPMGNLSIMTDTSFVTVGLHPLQCRGRL